MLKDPQIEHSNNEITQLLLLMSSSDDCWKEVPEMLNRKDYQSLIEWAQAKQNEPQLPVDEPRSHEDDWYLDQQLYENLRPFETSWDIPGLDPSFNADDDRTWDGFIRRTMNIKDEEKEEKQ